MCVAIYKPSDLRVSENDMALAHAENNDGAGFAVRTSGGIYVDRGLWSFDEFWDRFQPWQDYEALIHFRYATAGVIDHTMCHPFTVGHGGAVIHNGHITGYGDKIESDTAAWVKTVLDPLLRSYPDIVYHKAFQKMLGENIAGNKLAIMLPDKPVVLVGSGITENGIWYSNLFYRTPVHSKYRPVTKLLPKKDIVEREDTLDIPGNWLSDDNEYDPRDEPKETCLCEVCQEPGSEAAFFVCEVCYEEAIDSYHRFERIREYRR